MKRCPACSEILYRRRIDTVELDGCPSCGGLWFDKGELQQLARDPKRLRAANASFKPGVSAIAATRSNACPACGQPLSPFEFDRFRGVRMDRCRACDGIWLDHGVAATIADKIEPATAAPAAPSAPPAAAAAPAAGPVAVAPAPTARAAPISPPRRALRPDIDTSGLDLAYDPYADRGAPEPAEAADVAAPGAPPPPSYAPVAAPPPPSYAPVAAPYALPDDGAARSFEPGRRQLPYGLLALGGIVLLLVIWWLWPVRLAQVTLQPALQTPADQAGAGSGDPLLAKAEPTVIDPCEGKSRCVVVVVAPWCPACKIATPIINAMLKKFEGSAQIGIKPVIAYDQEAKLLEMAKSFQSQAYLDPTGRLLAEMGDRGVPHWYVVNESNKVLEEVSGVYPDLNAQLDELGLGGE